MGIQDAINSTISTASQGVGLVTGLQKMEESNKKMEESNALHKAETEVQKIGLQNQLDQAEGDLAHEMRLHDASAPEGRISSDQLDEYVQGNIKANEDVYNQINKDLRDQRKLTGEAINNMEMDKNPSTISAYGRASKKEKGLMTDLEAANLATKTWKDKLTTMQTLRGQINVLNMKGGNK